VCCDSFVLLFLPQAPFPLLRFVAANAAGCDHIPVFDHNITAGFRCFTSPAAFRAYVQREILSLEPLAPMTRQPIYLCSMQKEFAAERLALGDVLQVDPLLRRFFEPVLFEDLPANDRYRLYVGLFGSGYGRVDAEGISPTQREFQRAGERGKPRLIFLKAADDTSRDPRMLGLIRKAEASLVRRRFATTAELIGGLMPPWCSQGSLEVKQNSVPEMVLASPAVPEAP
jgi:hypothetical protein